MSTTHLVLACLISALPGPPGIRYEDAYIQLLPVDKAKCPTIDPVRDISYHLFTRNNPLMPDVLKIGDDDALAHSHMNFSDPTVIFFHGFLESSQGTTAWTIKTAYLQKKQHNLFLLNAPRLEAGPWYFTAARNTRVVGEYTATFIDYLVSRGLHLPSLHLVGLSLGAQMAGVTGSNVKSGRIRRITGLDPAGPIFTKLPNSLKLDKSDGEFVDVIHSDAGIFGYPRAIGHVDFWPNRGISPQPGCHFPEIKKRNPDTIVELFFCSHWRSYQFYAESIINENGFLAISCKSWDEYIKGKCDPNQQPIHMGYSVPETAHGHYFLTTNPESPFSLEANPKTLAESKHESSVNPESQLPIQDNGENTKGYSDYKGSKDNENLYSLHKNYFLDANLNLPFPLEENSRPLADSKHEAHENHYLSSVSPDTHFLTQENIKKPKEEDIDKSLHLSREGYFLSTILQLPFSLKSNPQALAENKHETHKNNYDFPLNFESHFPIQENVEKSKQDGSQNSKVDENIYPARGNYFINPIDEHPFTIVTSSKTADEIKHEAHKDSYQFSQNSEKYFPAQENVKNSKPEINEGSKDEKPYSIVNYVQEGYLNSNPKIFIENQYKEPSNYESHDQYYPKEKPRTAAKDQYVYY